MSVSARSISARSAAASAASWSRISAISASVQRFSPCRTGRAAAPECAVAVMCASLGAVSCRSSTQQSPEDKCRPAQSANVPAAFGPPTRSPPPAPPPAAAPAALPTRCQQARARAAPLFCGSMRRRLPALPTSADLPAFEHEVLRRWAVGKIFERSLEQTADGQDWVFYEGPPTANGMPGAHHIEARVFKDLFPRFKTMQGFHVPRRAGWDCHGLPVEVAVEKQLGFSGKQDIEAYGVAEFNAKCRESVKRHVGEFEKMTERMGYWVDLSEAYWTMNPGYIESVWWTLKQIFEKGLLVQDHRVAPYCPRCGTGLSDHELAQGYETVVDPSVYVRMPLTSGPLAGKAALLVWTTT